MEKIVHKLKGCTVRKMSPKLKIERTLNTSYHFPKDRLKILENDMTFLVHIKEKLGIVPLTAVKQQKRIHRKEHSP